MNTSRSLFALILLVAPLLIFPLSTITPLAPLTSPFVDLSVALQGSGKAKSVWQSLRAGRDPLTEPLDPTDDLVLSPRARLVLQDLISRPSVLPSKPEEITKSECGTVKFLTRLTDGNAVETVLIPSPKHSRTTVCVSTQVGCDRGCKFCATAKMGIIRSLTGEEIVSQVVQSVGLGKELGMSPCRNVVFMGMGDAGMNVGGVSEAALALSDPTRMGLSASKVTISTVGPSPEVFQSLADLPCSMAWSLHSPVDSVRKLLVPSTKHTTMELRDGLCSALASRSSARSRAVMIACTLLKGINDSDEHADELAKFVKPIEGVAGKVVLDIIPYNDIDFGGLVPPTEEDIERFTRRLKNNGCFVAVRKSRGEEDNAACGMLATARKKKK